MKKYYKTISMLLILCMLTSAFSATAFAANELSVAQENGSSITIAIPEENLAEFEEMLDYEAKTTYLAETENGVAPCSEYTLSLGAYATKSYPYGYVSSGTTMYMKYSNTNARLLTATLYSSSSSDYSSNDVVFNISTPSLERTRLSTGNYYKLSLKNETAYSTTVYLTVYTY